MFGLGVQSGVVLMFNFIIFLIFRAFATAEEMGVLISLPIALGFLALTKLMHPHPPQSNKQVVFIDLACDWMNFPNLISWPGPYRGKVGSFLFLDVSTSKIFKFWFAPTLKSSDKTCWCLPLVCLDFLGVYFQPYLIRFP